MYSRFRSRHARDPPAWHSLHPSYGPTSTGDSQRTQQTEATSTLRTALVIVAGLLAYENGLVKPDDLSRINVAFFNLNSYVAITLFIGVLLGIFLR